MVFLTQNQGTILGPIAKVLGMIFNGLFDLTAHFGVLNVGLAIILFTIVIKLLMLPLTIKQMKFSKMSSYMNPELQAIQKKYKGKTDNDSVMKMNEEQKAVYEKYGTSPTGGCVQMLIQMPILFALYRVIQNIPAYVSCVKDVFINMLEGTHGLMAQPDFATKMVENFGGSIDSYSAINSTIDVMNMFKLEDWDKLIELFPACSQLISTNIDQLFNMYNFFGINLSVNPSIKSIAIIIPILTAFTQWISMKTIGNNNAGNDDNPAMQSMKTMNTIMPLMTGFIAFSLPSGLGLYWIATAVCQTIQQLVLNVYFDKTVDMDKLVEKNIEKANKKREKKGLPANKISSAASTNTKSISDISKYSIQQSLEETKKRNLEKVEEIKKASNYYNDGAKQGSLSSKANMVKKFNEKNK